MHNSGTHSKHEIHNGNNTIPFLKFAGPQIFMGTSIIRHAIFFIDDLMVRHTVDYYRMIHRLA
jgi:hypothetical protein